MKIPRVHKGLALTQRSMALPGRTQPRRERVRAKKEGDFPLPNPWSTTRTWIESGLRPACTENGPSPLCTALKPFRTKRQTMSLYRSFWSGIVQANTRDTEYFDTGTAASEEPTIEGFSHQRSTEVAFRKPRAS